MKGDRTLEMDAFVEDAKATPIVEAFERAGFSTGALRRQGGDLVGPCPACGGRDRFAISVVGRGWNCRGAEGGKNPVSLVMHLTGETFLDACEILVGRERPGRDDGDDAARAVRRCEAEARLAEQRRLAAIDEAKRTDETNSYREREQDRCRKIWREAGAFDCDGVSAKGYLAARGLDVAPLDGSYLRTHPRLGFFAKPERGASVAIHYGPAMLGQFVRLVANRWHPVGLHQTWLDLGAGPKFRPVLVHPETGELLPSKKMRGSKAGGLIPVHGRISRATRMVSGEGIETAIGFARWDGWRDDTFYCAAGDLGNLCGRAMPGCRIRHPTLVTVDAAGRKRAAQVPGVEPDFGSETIPVPEHITELVLLGDGDSETVMTRAALKRGCTRHGREGRVVRSIFAPAGTDWGEVRLEEAA